MAEAEDSGGDATTLAPIVVRDAPPPAFRTYPEFAPGQVTVITRDQFRSDQISVADVLEASPGVQVQKTGERGSYQALTVRGASGQQSLVYLDGVLLTSAGGEAVDLGQLPLAQVQSIEIYRSVAPAQFAQDAMGGVVNIVTRPAGTSGSSTDLALKTGSFGLIEASAARVWQGERQRFSLRAAAVGAENDFPYRHHAGTPDVPEDDVEVTRNNAGYERYNLAADYQYQRGGHQWQATASGRLSRKELPAWDNSARQDTEYRDREIGGTLGWSTNGLLDGRMDSSLRLRYREGNGHLKDPTGSIGLAQSDSRDRDQSARLSHVGVFYLGAHLTTVVNEFEWTAFELDDPPSNRDYRHERGSHALSITDELGLWRDRLRLGGALRALNAEREASLFGGHLNASFDIDAAWTVSALVKQAFRLPSLYERFGDQGYFRGNPDLDSERSRQVEASIQRTTDRTELELTGYYRVAVDNIAPVYDSQGVGRYVNIGEVHYQGLEWWAQWQHDGLTLDHQGAIQPSRMYSEVVAYDGHQAPGYYPYSLSSQIRQSMLGVELGLRWRYERGLYYDRANSTLAPVRSEFDLSARKDWQWRSAEHRFEITLANVLDSRSMDMTRKPLPGRQFVAGYSLHF